MGTKILQTGFSRKHIQHLNLVAMGWHLVSLSPMKQWRVANLEQRQKCLLTVSPPTGTVRSCAYWPRALVRDFPIRSRAVEFFKGLSVEVRSLPVFRHLEGVLHVHRGVPEDAIAPFRAAFDEIPGIDTLLHLITALLRVGNRDAVETLFRSKDFDGLPGSSLDRINFCHVLLDFGEAERALELGYQAVIEGLDSVEVVNKFLGLLLVPSPSRPESFDGAVTDGVWIRLTPSLGDACVGLIGEEEDRPWGPKVDPNNAFFAKALGKKAGDTFRHTNAATGATEIWTVAEVKPRWLQAFHYLSTSYAQRFPTSTQFASLALAEDDVGPALEQVRRHSDSMRSRADLYLIGKVPMALIAGNEVGGSVAFAEYLISIGAEVRVCYGTIEERIEALAFIQNGARSGAVLDAFTAWHAARLGIFPILEERLGPLAIPANEMHRLSAMAGLYRGGQGQETMSLSYQNGKYIRHMTTPEERAERLGEIESCLAAIRASCEVEPLVIPNDLSEAGEVLIHLPTGDVVAPAIMAGQDRLLLSEDMVMRQMASKVYGVTGVWLQAVLLSALQAGTITRGAYGEALVYLSDHRHSHVALDSESLLSAFEVDEDEDLSRLRSLCAHVGGKNAELFSNVRLAAIFLNAIWADAPHDPKVQKATEMVLRAMLLHNRGDEWATWAASLVLALDEKAGVFLWDWCQQQSQDATEIERVLQRWSGTEENDGEVGAPRTKE